MQARDGQPTAYYARGRLYCEWPLSFGGISMRAAQETLKEVERVTRNGVVINTFMLDDSPSLRAFVERMTRINRGRALFTRPDRLGEYLRKLRETKDRYDRQIKAEDDALRERRLDAIRVFEEFVRKHPNHRRWTPNAIFRLAELYYEKAFEDYVLALDDFPKQQEAYAKAIESGKRPEELTPVAEPKADYDKVVSLYRRLLTEFPEYRFNDATHYLLGYVLTTQEAKTKDEARGRQAFLREKKIQQQAGAGAPLPVDEAHPGAGQVFDGAETLGVARGQHQALLAPGQVDELQRQAGQITLNKRHIIGVGLRVQHVAAAQVGPALAQGHQASQAAHVAGGETQPRVSAAQQGGQQVQGVVVAAQDHQGAVAAQRGVVVVDPGVDDGHLLPRSARCHWRSRRTL